jgi:NAD(P)-dependent dehydrogenase (short-subunit alcohol dehydrogenase family)
MPDTGVVVTGGASGIGRASALALAEAGRPVALWDVNAEGVEAAAREVAALGVTSAGVHVDVSDPESLQAAATTTRDALPSIGGIVHAAGIVVAEPIGSVIWDHWTRVLDINLTAHARIVQLLLDDLRAHDGSAIVGIASIEAVIGHFAIPAYCSSKAGLVGLTRSMAARLGPLGIRANAICPGYIDTPMLASVSNPEVVARQIDSSMLGRLGRPEDIGRVARFLLSDDAAFITGQAIVVDGGVTAID